MNRLNIKDNQCLSKEKFIGVQGITAGIANKTLSQLEESIFVFPESLKYTRDLDKDQIILKEYKDSFATGNVMGYLGIENEYLEIESRFSIGDKDYFLQYLLERVLDIPNFVSLSTEISKDEKLFMLLVFLFPYYLKKAMRKGIFKSYICNEYNDKNIRGKIDVDRHIKENSLFIGNIAYTKREYSFDNYLTGLIRHTIEYIKSKSYGNRLLRKVREEVNIILKSSRGYLDKASVIEKNRQKTVRHAYYSEYRELQKLCILILKKEKYSFEGSGRKMYGILFDGAWLFEEYINLLIGDSFYHPMNKEGIGKQYLFSGNIGMVYPDFIGKDIENRVIADAKYKPIDNIGNKDYLQMLAYMLRFDSKRGVFLYPESLDNNIKTLTVNRGLTYEDNVKQRDNTYVLKYGLKVPQYADSYSDFVDKIKVNEDKLKNYIYSI